MERAETSPANASPEGGSTSITHVGRVFTSDTFYGQPASELDLLRASGHLAVEMEAAGLFGVAASEGVAAAALLTVSDHLNGDTHLSAQERQVGFSAMAEVALDAVTV